MTTASEDLLKRITARPDVFNGKPIIRDMRISVELVLSLLSQGASHEELKDDYPDLEEEDILACIAYAHAELPFRHSPAQDQDPEPDYTPDEPDPVVHYAPGDRPLCGNESMTAVYTDEPDAVAGCDECLELVAEDLQDPDTHYGGYCLHCRREITATGSVEWRRVVRRACPHCGRPGW